MTPGWLSAESCGQMTRFANMENPEITNNRPTVSSENALSRLRIFGLCFTLVRRSDQGVCRSLASQRGETHYESLKPVFEEVQECSEQKEHL